LTRPLDRTPARLAVLGALVLALGLAGCGRKGALDPPPGAAAPAETQKQAAPPARTGGLTAFRSPRAPQPKQRAGEKPAETAASGFDEDGNPLPGTARRQRFFLDWLLD
jgi:predicted small lipoprotein YifL